MTEGIRVPGGGALSNFSASVATASTAYVSSSTASSNITLVTPTIHWAIAANPTSWLLSRCSVGSGGYASHSLGFGYNCGVDDSCCCWLREAPAAMVGSRWTVCFDVTIMYLSLPIRDDDGLGIRNLRIRCGSSMQHQNLITLSNFT
jgi:hypothetical protein